MVDSTLLQSMEWRLIGPHRGGRVVAVAGDPEDRATFYFGACAGGVWKTVDGGTYWENVSDGFFATAAVGAIAVAPSDPNVIYAGMGEACIRGNVSHGDGVYRSTDAGRTWTHRGLADTRFIGRVRVHPRDPDLVYVAALGHAFGPNRERGVFRSKNGGETWEQVLFRNEDTGAVDLSLDPHNPRVLFAAFWDVRRTPWSLTSGGPGSGLFRSTDGGDTWTELTGNPGLPGGLKGRIGVAVSPARRGRVWALIEAEEGGLFRSDDGGDTWERISEDREIRQRPWYYMHVFADPIDGDTCYILNLKMWQSIDGGRTFAQVTTPHGDNHDLWIDPRDPRRMIEGNDGGACVSFNGGASWSTIYNQPTAQFYHLTTDNRFPYRVYGTQQDNSAICVPSRSPTGAIPYSLCYAVGSSESGHIQVDPRDPDIVYSGAIGSAPGGGGVLLRYDHGTGQTRIITAWPEIFGGYGPRDLKHRFQWTFPIVISPHDPSVLYIAGERLFRSADEGMSWEAISPDLTRNDPEKLGPSGGPITRDTTGAEHYCTIFALTESPHARGHFWVGTDDGLIHRSRDGGATWQEVTPPDLPEWSTVNVVEVSPHDPTVVYVAAWRYKLDDDRPLLFRTGDGGATWTAITDGLPATAITRTIRADPVRPGLLYCGTENGIYLSFDDGGSWQSLQGNLPVAPVYDLQVKDGDLVAATHGRSFWILDDLSPLRQATPEVLTAPAHLFDPSVKVRTRPLPGAGRPGAPGKNYSFGLGAAVTYVERKRPDGDTEVVVLDGGKNPPDGAVVTYYLKDAPKGDVTLTFLDAADNVIRRYSSAEATAAAPAEPRAPDEAVEGDEGIETAELAPEVAADRRVPKRAGLNRFVWNMRYPDAVKVPGDATTEQSLAGPVVPPGTYAVRLEVDGFTATKPLEVVKDPRVRATREDFDAQSELLIQVRDKLSETHTAINRIRALRDQAGAWAERAAGRDAGAAVRAAARTLMQDLTEVEEALIQPRAKGQLDTIHFPVKLNSKLAALTSVIASADGAPTTQSYAVFAELSAQIDAELARLRRIESGALPALNDAVRAAGLPAVVG